MSQCYRVVIDPQAIRDLARLHPNVRRDVLNAARLLEDAPRPPGAKHLDGSDYRLRVRGDYRIVYEVDDDMRMVRVFAVAGRARIYDLSRHRS